MSIPQEELLIRGLLNAASAGDLKFMKECAEKLDFGKGLVETYTVYRGPPEGLSALHYGAAGGRTHICKYLIEVVGVDINLQDGKGDTVLNHAIGGQNLQTVAYLLRKGANVNLANNKGFSALHNATLQGLNEALHLLISNGADIEALSQTGTPLHCAATLGKTEALKILLDNNANPNAMWLSYTPLVLSILHQSQDCFNLLLKAGADPNLGGDGETPLEAAASEKDTEGIKSLLKAGANPNVTNIEGMTPLEISAFHHNHEAVMILLPKTYPVPTIPDWTFHGVIKAVHSQEARNQRELKRKESVVELKSKGAEAFKKMDYLTAIVWYSRANARDPMDATVLSNKSMCWARMNDGDSALSDAEACIALKPDWSKAHYRKGVACEILKDFVGAAKAYAFALKLEPGNEEIKTAFRKVQALGLLRC